MASTLSAGSRSPRFPSHSIREAIVYVEKIYAGVHRSPIDALTAFRLMGFAGKSGASSTALGSVRQFGLIEGTGDKTRISELSLRILEPASPEERNQAVLEAARKPEVFKSIFERFDGRIPAADEPLRAFLIRELGFSKRGVDECLVSLRATLDVVADISSASTSAKEAIAGDHADPLDRELPHELTEPRRQSESLRILLTRELSVELRFNGPITEKGLTNLIRQLELTKEALAQD